MAEAFTTRGLTVKLVEQAPAVMPTIDMSSANCSRGASPSWCPGDQGGHRQGIHREHDGLVAVGGIETGVRSAVRVDRCMRTNLADVLAGGDCVETHTRVR